MAQFVTWEKNLISPPKWYFKDILYPGPPQFPPREKHHERLTELTWSTATAFDLSFLPWILNIFFLGRSRQYPQFEWLFKYHGINIMTCLKKNNAICREGLSNLCFAVQKRSDQRV